MSFTIDNSLPDGVRPNWLIGAGATSAERGLMYATGVVGASLVWLLILRDANLGWSWWQVALAMVIALDLFAGAMSNAASSTKRQYQAPLAAGSSTLARIAHSPVGFAAIHVYPFVIVTLYPGGTVIWAFGWYVAMLVAVVLLSTVIPGYLRRPVAMTIFVLAVPFACTVTAPPGWVWFPFVFLAKLVLGHAVHEEAYRPSVSAPGAGATT